MAIQIVRNDYGFNLEITVKQHDGAVLDLTGSTITFTAAPVDSIGTAQATGTCTLSNPTAGVCKYPVASGDFNVAGEFRAEIYIAFASEFITAQLDNIQVLADLG